MADAKYILRDKDISTLELAKWVKSKLNPDVPVSVALDISRSLKDGKPWIPFHWTRNEKGYCPCDVEMILDAEELQQKLDDENRIKHNDYCSNLLARGASGDIAAALEYCKLEFDGQVNHWAYASAR
jgi:chromosome condensin MukBEF complex kleisin-like MukF subunit